MADGMTPGEAYWILGGLALQAGLCPLDRAPLRDWRIHAHQGRLVMYHCPSCYRDWYLDTSTGRCCGWWLTTKGWTWQKAPGY